MPMESRAALDNIESFTKMLAAVKAKTHLIPIAWSGTTSAGSCILLACLVHLFQTTERRFPEGRSAILR